jgi:hypothetical protein
MTFLGLSPKYAFFAKKSAVSRRVGPLVMTYQGMMTVPAGFLNSSSATVCNRAMRSAWYWKRDLWEGRPIS